MKRTLNMGLILAATALSAACSKSSDVNDEELDGPIADSGTTTLDAGSSGGSDASGGDATVDAGRSSDASTREDGGGQRPAQECPTTVPVNGSPCVSGRGDCTLGTTFCDCPRETQQWICWSPADCPTQVPAQGAGCTLVGMTCDIAGPTPAEESECECTNRGWECEGRDDDEQDAGVDAGARDAGAPDSGQASDGAADTGNDAAG